MTTEIEPQRPTFLQYLQLSSSLGLPQIPSVLFFFGLAGSGKTHVARILGECLGWHVYEADEDLTDRMKKALKQRTNFTDDMRDEYFQIIINKIDELRKTHKHIIVTQATYKNRHRSLLLSSIQDISLIWVQANPAIITQRLRERGDAVTSEYAAQMSPGFELPNPGLGVKKLFTMTSTILMAIQVI
jgi:gluconokinase